MSDFDTLIGLVSRYSPSGSERRAVEWLVERMKSLGYDESFIDEVGNAVGVIGKGEKQVILLGHIDTVSGEIKVDLTPNPSPERRGEVVYGRGSVDAKGPLACFVDAVANVGIKDGWQFVVIGAIEEERDSEGARFVVNQYKPDFAIIGEPNHWDRIALGYKGSAWANVIVKREQTHTASGEETAAEVAVDVWLKIKAYVNGFNEDKKRVFDQLLLTLRGIDSSQDGFEQQATLKVGVRLPVEVSPEDWYQRLKEIVGDANVEPKGFAIPAWACEKNTQLVRSFLSGIRSQGGEPRFVYKTGTADLNIVAPVWKCPAVVYGPGDSTLDHTPNEHIELEEYAKSVIVLSETLKKLTSPTQ
ncbi:MAG: [LysW]-lysine hydrolase [Anaerolineales bacterium]|nr:[LysW]-lysine hydrolase [Anaerolineales bacterium]MBX3035919.1 [LysW]-lysine hydrolase [Anaerolineales bacterium]